METTVLSLDSKKAWNLLNEKDRQYTYQLFKASWATVPIVLQQTSEESIEIFELLQEIFRNCEPKQMREKCETQGLPIDAFFEYATMFYGSLGNYTGYGNIKIIPQLTIEETFKIIEITSPQSLLKFEALSEKIYNYTPNRVFEENMHKKLDFGNTAFLSDNANESDKHEINKLKNALKIDIRNTRLVIASKDTLRFKVASGTYNEIKQKVTDTERVWHVIIQYGDFIHSLKKICVHLNKAKKLTDNHHKKQMLSNFETAYQTGIMSIHDEGCINWLNDKDSTIEFVHGPIESYRDPFKERCSFQGIVGIVDRELSSRRNLLVNIAPELIKKLPYDEKYRGKFVSVNFYCINLLCCVNYSTPAGMCLPNDKNLRANYGIKNLYNENVIRKLIGIRNLDCISHEDNTIIQNYIEITTEIMVSLHELVGHPSGKAEKDWESHVGNISKSLEECRAECVALYLITTEPSVLEVFGVTKMEERKNIIKTAWLDIIIRTIKGLQYYDPETKKWSQSHCCGRFAILNYLCTNCEGLIDIKLSVNEKYTVKVHPPYYKEDANKGVENLGKFIADLQKIKGGAFNLVHKLFTSKTVLSDRFLKLRAIILKTTKPQPIWVQPNLVEEDGKIIYKEYPSTNEGIIQSFIDRHNIIMGI